MLAALGVLLAAMLGGCGGSGNGTNLPDPLERFVNVSPDSVPLDFYINDDVKAPSLAYLASSGNVTVLNGDKDISVRDGGTTLDAVAFTFQKDKQYLALAVGLENYLTETEKRLRLVAFQYDKNPPNGSKARLLVEHAFSRAAGFLTPNIDFQGGPSATYDPNNPQFKVADVAFAEAPTTLEVDSDVPIIFQVRRAGTENVYASSTDTFDPGGIYLALATGVEGAAGAQAPSIVYVKLN